jgi:predicted RNA-binding protein with PUA-like domain
MIDLKFRRRLKHTITLPELKSDTRLDGFQLLKRGNRLSVMPVSKHHWEIVLGLENKG